MTIRANNSTTAEVYDFISLTECNKKPSGVRRNIIIKAVCVIYIRMGALSCSDARVHFLGTLEGGSEQQYRLVSSLRAQFSSFLQSCYLNTATPVKHLERSVTGSRVMLIS